MKNIHVLSTEKPSRLWMTKLGNLTRCHDIRPIKEGLGNNLNIYITSDEEIKDGDYYLYLKDNSVQQFIKKHHTKLLALGIQKKIILTDNKDLIADGVQAIDDEFLEWFVKNPSCEYVNIEKYCRNGLCDSKSRSKRDKMDEHRHEDPKDKCWYSGCQCPGKRLIIPKEIHLEDIFNDEKKEGIKKLIQKQKLIDMMEQDEQLGLYEETLEEVAENYWTKQIYNEIASIEGAKWQQETLEEASKNPINYTKETNGYPKIQAFIDGAKWQEERSYNEEDMRQAFNNGAWRWRMHSKVDIFKEWLNKFKKK